MAIVFAGRATLNFFAENCEISTFRWIRKYLFKIVYVKKFNETILFATVRSLILFDFMKINRMYNFAIFIHLALVRQTMHQTLIEFIKLNKK